MADTMEARGALVSDKQRVRTQAKASTRASGFSMQPQIDYPSLKLFCNGWVLIAVDGPRGSAGRAN